MLISINCTEKRIRKIPQDEAWIKGGFVCQKGENAQENEDYYAVKADVERGKEQQMTLKGKYLN